MKTTFLHSTVIFTIAVCVSCGVSKKSNVQLVAQPVAQPAFQPAAESVVKTQTNLEGETIRVETKKLQGIEMSESLSEDGTSMILRPFKWYAGVGIADNKQVAIELAQREAYSTISRVIENIDKYNN